MTHNTSCLSRRPSSDETNSSPGQDEEVQAHTHRDLITKQRIANWFDEVNEKVSRIKECCCYLWTILVNGATAWQIQCALTTATGRTVLSLHNRMEKIKLQQEEEENKQGADNVIELNA